MPYLSDHTRPADATLYLDMHDARAERKGPAPITTAGEATTRHDGQSFLAKTGENFPCVESTGKLDGVNWKVDENCNGVTSQSTSPPHGGLATSKLRIMPCPSRLFPYSVPPNYGAVTPNLIYRSSFPQVQNIDFCDSLGVKSILNLVKTEPCDAYNEWVLNAGIYRTSVEVAPNKDSKVSTTNDSICEAVLYMMDSTNYPLYVHCNQGRHRTGCVVACLRKVQRMPLDEVLHEYHTYAWPKVRPGDVELIRSFDPEVVFEYAKAHGYLGGNCANGTSSTQPRLRRLDSTITDLDTLAAALAAGAMGDAADLNPPGYEDTAMFSVASSTTGDEQNEDDELVMKGSPSSTGPAADAARSEPSREALDAFDAFVNYDGGADSSSLENGADAASFDVSVEEVADEMESASVEDAGSDRDITMTGTDAV